VLLQWKILLARAALGFHFVNPHFRLSLANINRVAFISDGRFAPSLFTGGREMKVNPIIEAIKNCIKQGKPIAGVNFDSLGRPNAFYFIFENGSQSSHSSLLAFTPAQRRELMASARTYLDLLE
jgi:hypothetical protein